MNDSLFEIGAPGVDVEALVARIRERVAEKKRQDVYADTRIVRAERANLSALKDDDEFLALYLECLRDAVFVDINDFEIVERRSRFACFFVSVKRLIWNGLKFYTYRMWTQQNQVNGLFLSALDCLEARHRERVQALEKRIAELEKAAAESARNSV